MDIVVRRVCAFDDELAIEADRPVSPPLQVVGAAAVIVNPLAGRWVEDLSELRTAAADPIGKLLRGKIVGLLRGPVEAYGKGALVGQRGEIEHGSVIIHTLEFGNHLRELGGGSSLVPSAEKRGPAGATIDIPLKHAHDVRVRSHHMTHEVRVADAPHDDEIVVFMVASTGGRPHARSGSLMDELATESA